MSWLRFSLREIFLVTLVVALLLAWGTQAYLRQWPTAKERALMQQRLERLQRIVSEQEAIFGEGTKFDHKALRDAELEALVAEIELAEGHSQRVKLHERIVEATRRYETIAAHRYEVGSGTHQELLGAETERLKAEIDLERAKAGR